MSDDQSRPAVAGRIDRPVRPDAWIRHNGAPYTSGVAHFGEKCPPGWVGAGPVFAHWSGIEGGAPRERKGGIMEPGLLMRDGSMHPDARLIEAAPELLRCLQAVEALFAPHCKDSTQADWLDRTQALLRRLGAA